MAFPGRGIKGRNFARSRAASTLSPLILPGGFAMNPLLDSLGYSWVFRIAFRIARVAVFPGECVLRILIVRCYYGWVDA